MGPILNNLVKLEYALPRGQGYFVFLIVFVLIIKVEQCHRYFLLYYIVARVITCYNLCMPVFPFALFRFRATVE